MIECHIFDRYIYVHMFEHLILKTTNFNCYEKEIYPEKHF